MIVLVAGGTGFLGKRVVHFLEKNGHTAIVHHRGFQAVPTYADAIVNCVGVIRGTDVDFRDAHVEKTRWLLKLAKKLQVTQFVQVSALGVEKNEMPYQRTKLKGERLVERSGLPYAIIRPSMIFGQGDKSLSTFRKLARSGFLPVFSEAKVQPVHVDTVAQLIVAAVDRRIRNRTVEVGGPEVFTYRSLGERLHPGVTTYRLPVPFVWLITFFGMFITALPTKDMVRMMRQDSTTKDKTDWRLGIENPSVK